MLLKGRMLANAFLSEFTSDTIPSVLAEEDPATRFPWNPCPVDTLPSDGNFCWIDYRDESVMSELCTDDGSTGGGGSTTADQSSAEMIMGQTGLGMMFGTAVGLFFFA